MTARPGDRATDEHRRALAASFPWLLLVDELDRPLAWVARQDVRPGEPLADAPCTAAEPLLDRRATLKDALSILLGADVHAGIVVDRTRRVLGLVTVAAIAGVARDAGPDLGDDGAVLGAAAGIADEPSAAEAPRG